MKHWSLSAPIDEDNTALGNTVLENIDEENKTGADYKILDNNQTGSIDDNH
ncbi:MAG: hypothetical protein H6Q73_4369 [Firmicutes bacterium]|nr:hypothetical protein [Bacillota bacterium]